MYAATNPLQCPQAAPTCHRFQRCLWGPLCYDHLPLFSMINSKMYYAVLQNKPYFSRLRGLAEACCVNPGEHPQDSKIPVHCTARNSTWLPGSGPIAQAWKPHGLPDGFRFAERLRRTPGPQATGPAGTFHRVSTPSACGWKTLRVSHNQTFRIGSSRGY